METLVQAWVGAHLLLLFILYARRILSQVGGF